MSNKLTVDEIFNDDYFDVKIAKAQFSQLVNEIIGEDQKAAREAAPVEKQLFPDYRRIDYRNDLRQEQRQRAIDLGFVLEQPNGK